MLLLEAPKKKDEETVLTDDLQSESTPKWWLFKKGQCGNPNGRPKGAKSYQTLFFQALTKLAEDNNMTGKEKEIFLDILARGITEARKGKFLFYEDLMNRLFGKAVQPMDLTTGGESLNEPLEIIFTDFSK